MFGPVWTTLYVLMALAAWLVWRERDRADTRGPLLLYVVHLAFNALWSWLFFAWRQGGLAFAEVLVLLALTFALNRAAAGFAPRADQTSDDRVEAGGHLGRARPVA